MNSQRKQQYRGQREDVMDDGAKGGQEAGKSNKTNKNRRKNGKKGQEEVGKKGEHCMRKDPGDSE